MSDLQIFFLGLAKIIWNFRLVLAYIIVYYLVRRWRLEKKRMAKVTKRDKLKGVYHQEHVS